MINNSQTDTLISEAMKETGDNISKVARLLGIDYFALKARYPENSNQSFTSALGPEPDDIRTLGKAGLSQYVVAVKRRGFAWPKHYGDVIANARRRFDAGTHIMVQSIHADGWVVQYLIPRMIKMKPRNYFSSMVEIT